MPPVLLTIGVWLPLTSGGWQADANIPIQQDEKGNDEKGVCGICKEKLETYFHDEDGEDEWRFRNAFRSDDQLYHYTCWKDAEKVGRLTTLG